MQRSMAPGVGSQSHRDKPDTILAFYRIDPFPQTISNYWLMFGIIAAPNYNGLCFK